MTELTILANSPLADQPSMLGYGRALGDTAARIGLLKRIITPPGWIGRLMAHLPRAHPTRRFANNLDRFGTAPVCLTAWRALHHVDMLHVVDPGNLIYLPYLRPRRVVVTVHDMIPHLAARGDLPGRPARRARQWYLGVLRRYLPRCDRIICVSAATRDDLIRLSPVDPARIEVIHNSQVQPLRVAGLQTRADVRARLAMPPDAPVLLHIGRNFYKNRAAVLSVFEQLKQRRPDARLILVGELEPGLQVGRGVDVLTRVTSGYLSGLYAAADVLLFPSLTEGFGLPVIEAQAAGLPVVCSDRGSLPEVAGQGALLCAPHDIHALTQAVLSVLDQPNLAAQLRAYGRRNVMRFDPVRWAQAHETLWDDLSRAPPSDLLTCPVAPADPAGLASGQ